MSDFSGYEKMPTSLKKLGLSPADFSKLEKCQWVVTEKVHGANFSFVYEAGTLKYAKRKAYLSWDDDFFGFQLVVNQLEDAIIQLFEALAADYTATKYILYGELFGGEYPHPEVSPVEGVHAIQTGVYYAPGIHFCAFDIALESDGNKQYLDYRTAVSYFEAHGIFHAQPLHIGKINEAMAFDTRISSRIPAALGLPALQANLIEGIVIKPYDFPAEHTLPKRAIFKLKNKEFEEEKRYHEAKKWSFVPDFSSNSEELSFIVEELRNYVTHNRLESAISKIGALDFTRPERVAEIEEEMVIDTLADFNDANEGLFGMIGDAQADWLEARVRAACKMLMEKP